MPVRLKPFNDYTHRLDGGEVRFKLARMTAPQYAEFNAMYQAWSNGRGNQAQPPSDGESIGDVQGKVAAEVDYQRAAAEWVAEVFRTYVHIVPGDLIHEAADGDDEVVTTGDRFAQLYQADVPTVLAELWLQNSLTDEQKKTLRLQRASGTGSSAAPHQAAPGPRPETVAKPAEPEAFAAPEDATDESSDTSCGTTPPSCFEPVPSVN